MLTCILFASGSIHAQTWNGAGGNDLWDNGNNWTLGIAPLNLGTAAVAFGGTTRLTPDMNANWSILSLTFNSGAGAFTLGSTGNSTLTIQTGGITNSSTNLQTISNAITLGAAQTWSATSGNLAFSGNITNGGNLLTISGGSNTTASGVISGTGGLTKSGTGTLTLSGTNTYTGATTVSAGSLFVNGSTASGSAVTVNGSGTTLGGTGTINGTVSVGSAAILEGGTGSTGVSQTLTMKGAVTMSTGSIIELALGPSLAHSTIAISGTTLSFATNQHFKFIELAGTTTGTYTGIITGVSDPGTALNSWVIDNSLYVGSFSWDGANGGEINLNLTAVPEPSTYVAGILALGALAYHQRQRFSALLRKR